MFRKYQVRLSRTTVSKILKDSDKWLSVSGVAAKQKRCRAAKFPDLEKALALWYQQVRWYNPPMKVLVYCARCCQQTWTPDLSVVIVTLT